MSKGASSSLYVKNLFLEFTMFMIKRVPHIAASLLFVITFSLLPSSAVSQPVTNQTVSEQMLIFEKRVLEKLDSLAGRIETLEKGGTPQQAGENLRLDTTLSSLQGVTGKFEEFSFVLSNLQRQMESMSKANQKSNEMFQQALGKVSKENSYVEKELSYQISAIKMTLQDLSYKLYQTEESLKKRITSIQERLGVTPTDDPSLPPPSTTGGVNGMAGTDVSDNNDVGMVSPVVSNVSMEDSYKTSYNDYLRQNYDLAIIGFTTFLQNFPDTSLSDNAQYWIGECYYSQKKMNEAIQAFETLLKKFPRSNKLLETKYKVARSYHKAGKIEKALAGYKALIQDSPGTAIADRAKEYINTLEGNTETEEAKQNNL